MFSAVIVEDEQPILNLMKHMIQRNGQYLIQGTYTDPSEALIAITQLQPDVAFLDVEMPMMNGIELANQLTTLSPHTKIVFTTAYRDYAVDAFRVQAFDYILKPVTRSAIEVITERLTKQLLVGVNVQRAVQGKIYCLGNFEVINAEGIPIHWPTRKTEELMAYMLCNPNVGISKWKLADLLWPQMDEERAIPNLHTTMYRLKKLLKDQDIRIEILKINEGYRLNTGEVQYDLLQFKMIQSEDELAVEQAEQLLKLYRGSLLQNKEYVWKYSLEKRYSIQFGHIVRELVKDDIEQRKWRKAEQRIECFLSIYPLDEEMNILLLYIYEQTNNKEKMVKHYKQFVEAFTLELGVEPSEGLKSFNAQFL
jgi:two-component SAPR family response regulator